MASVEHVRVRAWYRIQATYKYLHVGSDFLKIWESETFEIYGMVRTEQH